MTDNKNPEASESTDAEQQLVAKPIKRQNSRFLLEETKNENDKEQVMYRPEFGDKNPKNEKIWELMSSYIGADKKSIQRSIVNHVEYTLARTRFNFDNFGAYQAASFSVRDRLIEAWNDTQQFHTVRIRLFNLACRSTTRRRFTTSHWSS